MTIERRFSIELRFAAAPQLADTSTNEKQFRGYAALFDTTADIAGLFDERIAPGAFNRSLDQVAAGDLSVVALWNHDSGQPLGATASGKLKLSTDERGLVVDLDPSRMTDLMKSAVADGEMRMSFGFRVPKGGDAWERSAEGVMTRTITDLDLMEVSIVTFPAYADTEAALRSRDAWEAEQKPAFSASTVEMRKALMELKFKQRATK